MIYVSEKYSADYNKLSDAKGVVGEAKTNFDSCNDSLMKYKSSLCNDSVLMGPACDACLSAFSTISNNISGISNNFSVMDNYLGTVIENYKSGDDKAANVVLSFGSDGSISTTNFASTGNVTSDSIYNLLAAKGFNSAAICGILANIQAESNFRTTALGDNGTSYGLCQWHDIRWTNLKNYCSANGYDSSSVEGQVNFLVNELENGYSGVYNTLKSVPNTKDGAIQASKEWTINFEIPGNKYNEADRRSSYVDSYWNTYGK